MSQGKVHIGIGSELRAIAEGSTCPDTLKAIADEVDQMEREHEAMQHDIARMMDLGNSLVADNDAMRHVLWLIRGNFDDVLSENALAQIDAALGTGGKG